MMNVNNMINNPALFVTYNYSHEDKNRELYYYTDTEEYDTINGFG